MERYTRIKRLPFGITKAVQVFQRIMDTFIKNFKLKKTRAFLDDMLISGKDRKEHDENVSVFLKAAKQSDMTLSCETCIFGLTSINILGHVIGNGEIKPNSERLETLMNYPTPSSPAELRRLLGFFAYNAKWVPQYSDQVKLLLDAFEQKSFPLNECGLQGISHIKKTIASACLSKPLQNNGPIVIETDASNSAIGAVMSQAGRPLPYFSKSLSMLYNENTIQLLRGKPWPLSKPLENDSNFCSVSLPLSKQTKSQSHSSLHHMRVKLRKKNF